ncbi:hypothetical protein D9M72_527910 [compost metagenome]
MPRSSSAPPPSAGSFSRWAGSWGRLWLWLATTFRTSPMVPSWMMARRRIMCGRNRVHMASSATSPLDSARSAMSCASRAFMVNGFSTSTCLPAFNASSVFAWWKGCGVAM